MSKKLADFLLTNSTTILGTVRGNRVELPQNLKEIMNKKKLHETLLAISGKCMLHKSITFKDTKNKPTTVLDYNKTKCGVGVVDQMTRLYTTKVASRR